MVFFMKIYTFSEQYMIFFGTYLENKPQKIDTKIVVFFDIFKFKIVCLIFQKILLRNSL